MTDHLELLWEQYSRRLRDLLLRCCHFEFDRRGDIGDYYEHCCYCGPIAAPQA